MSGTTITHNVAVDYTGSRSIGGISVGQIIGPVTYQNSVGQIIGPVTYQNSVAPEDSLRAQQKRKVEILNWLSPLDFSTRQNEIFQAWQPGTCEWLLETKEFKKWASRRDDCSRRLWCYGKPGAGKTILASRIIDLLKDSNNPNTAAVIIYCSHDSRESQTIQNLVGSIIKQIFYGPRRNLTSAVDELYDDFESKKPTLERLWKVLMAEIAVLDRVYIVVDALDECPENDLKEADSYNPREELLAKLEKLLQLPNVMIMVTSRPIPDIQKLFNRPEIEISARDHDISLFLGKKIKASAKIAAYKQDDMIMGSIAKNCQGMFLLASLCWDSISRAVTFGHLKRALERLPSSLDDMYRVTIKRIQNQHESRVEYANAVLSWVSGAVRPLSMDELRCALAIAMERDGHCVEAFEDWLPDPNDLISFCAGLVILGEGGTVRLAHYSIQEFIERERDLGKLFPKASQEIALTCLRCLTLDDFTTGSQNPTVELMEARVQQVPILRYAGNFWFRHDFKVAGKVSPEISACFSKLFNPDNRKAYVNWLRIHSPHRGWLGECPWLSEDDPTIPPVTYYTSHFRLEELSVQILERYRDEPNIYQKMEFDLLEGAVTGGDITRVRYYLDKGLAKDLLDSNGEPLLMRAPRDNKDTILFLFERGAHANVRGKRGWNPLQWAARDGPLDLVKFWIAHGAKVRPDPGVESALHHAVYFGHADIVLLLLEHGAGADVNTNGEMGPLTNWAAKHGQLKIMEMLVEVGADLERVCDRGWSVMQWLLDEGRYYVIQGKRAGWGMGNEHCGVALFLLNRVSLNQINGGRSRNRFGQTILHWAAQKGYEDVAKVALRMGVDPKVLGGESVQVTASEVATQEGYPAIAALLV